ncbi:non-ribosomal peptide synthetase [Streptomyces sp. NPDC004457]
MPSNELMSAGPGTPADGTDRLPARLRLTPAQEQMWLADQLNPQRGGYLIPLHLRITGDLDAEALRGALGEIVARHVALRTGVRDDGNGPVAVLHPADAFTLVIRDLREAGEARAPGTRVEEFLSDDARAPLDLTAGPPVRASLLRIAEAEHVLCLTVHHMAFDGGSRDVLYRELQNGYSVRVGGTDADRAVPPGDDRPAHDGLTPDEDDTAADLAYWRESLAGLTPFELPTDRARPPRRAGAGAQHRFTVPQDVVTRLTALARRRGATPHMVLVAACQALLSRWSGRTDVTVGSTYSTRDRPGLDGVMGPFVNMLVLRGDTSANPSFEELVGRVREVALDAYEARSVAFGDLVRELGGDRDPSRTPLFQILVDHVVRERSAPDLPGLTVTELPDPCVGSKYDLSISFQQVRDSQVRDSLDVELTWDTALYEETTVRRLAGHLSALLAQVARQPRTRLADLVLIGEDERRQALALGTGPTAAHPDVCLHELFEAQAARTPRTAAVVDDVRELSYAELDAEAERLAAVLARHGVGPEVPVGIMLSRSAELVVAVLGVLKAGGAYLPIDPAAPEHRIEHILGEARPVVCITEPRRAERVRRAGAEPLAFSLDEPCGPPEPPTPSRRARVRPGNLCALYYTSGSTGRPKAVACTHRGWVNYVHWMQRQHALAPGETVLHKCPAGFDVMVAEVLWPLCFGGRVAVLAEGLNTDARAVIDAAVRYEAVQMQFVPTALDLFLDELTDDDVAGLNRLRSIASGGEALLPGSVRRLHARFGTRVRLDNNWGTTETSVDSTVYSCTGDDADRHPSAVSIGLPVDNHEVLVLDEHGEPAPLGTPGEIHVGGQGLARGYHGDPARTAERFVPHPFRAGDRLYRTGDQGRVGPDGSIEFLGRSDLQVKIRGVRLELGEVEAALRAHPAVLDAAAATWTAGAGDTRLVAYLVLDPAAGASTAEVRSFLTSRLMGSAMPSVLVALDALPRLSNGKLDRHALPEPDLDAARVLEYVAPRGEAESAVAEIWAELLGTSALGAHDNFFAAGGHSLLATRAVNRMREAFGVSLPLSLIFEAPTVALATAAVEQAVSDEISALSDEEVLRLMHE